MSSSNERPRRRYTVRRSGIHGRGVFALADIAKGTRLMEYIGERITHREADRRYAVEHEHSPHTMLFSVDDKTVRKLIESPFRERNPAVSRDGRWIAYQSDESGSAEVYVRPFPNVGKGKWQVSEKGGSRPVWAHNRRELFYVAPDNRLMAVGVQVDEARFLAGRPEPLLRVPPDQHGGAVRHHYAVSNDGQRFLLAPLAPESVSPTITVVLDWQAELEKR